MIALKEWHFPITANYEENISKHLPNLHASVNYTITGSDNGLAPHRRQAIIWTNDGILLIGPLETNFSEMLIKIHTFLFKKICLKISSGKWQPFCFGLNVLMVASYELTHWCQELPRVICSDRCLQYILNNPDSKVHGVNMGPIWGRQDPGGPHVGPMNFAIWNYCYNCTSVYGAMCISINDLSQEVSDHVFTWGIYSNMNEYNDRIFKTIIAE